MQYARGGRPRQTTAAQARRAERRARVENSSGARVMCCCTADADALAAPCACKHAGTRTLFETRQRMGHRAPGSRSHALPQAATRMQKQPQATHSAAANTTGRGWMKYTCRAHCADTQHSTARQQRTPKRERCTKSQTDKTDNTSLRGLPPPRAPRRLSCKSDTKPGATLPSAPAQRTRASVCAHRQPPQQAAPAHRYSRPRPRCSCCILRRRDSQPPSRAAAPPASGTRPRCAANHVLPWQHGIGRWPHCGTDAPCRVSVATNSCTARRRLGHTRHNLNVRRALHSHERPSTRRHCAHASHCCTPLAPTTSPHGARQYTQACLRP